MEQQGEEDDLDVLYMGGVQDPTGGLAESKRGRGADVRRLKRVRCYLGSTQCRKLSTVVSLLRDEPREIARSLTGRVQRSCAFAADVGTFPGAPPLPDGWRIGPIYPEAVLAPEVSPDESAPYARRLRDRRFRDAWGIWIEDELAHVSCMIPHEHDVLLSVRNLEFKPGEAAITHAITPPRLRGRGVSPLASQQMMEVAPPLEDSTLWAIAAESNTVSQQANTKTGSSRYGAVFRWMPDYLSGDPYLTWRGHRLRRHPGG